MTASPNYVTWSRGNGTGNGCCVALAALSLRQQMASFGLPLLCLHSPGTRSWIHLLVKVSQPHTSDLVSGSAELHAGRVTRISPVNNLAQEAGREASGEVWVPQLTWVGKGTYRTTGKTPARTEEPAG